VQHCGGGPGADKFDTLGALIDWVENGNAPGTLTASKRDANTNAVLFTRPICVYPQFPKYNGTGDPAQAASFTCATG
jgi:hypothetical protein